MILEIWPYESIVMTRVLGVVENTTKKLMMEGEVVLQHNYYGYW